MFEKLWGNSKKPAVEAQEAPKGQGDQILSQTTDDLDLVQPEPESHGWNVKKFGDPFKSDKFGKLIGDTSEQQEFRQPSVGLLYGGSKGVR